MCRVEFGTIFASSMSRSGSGRFYIKKTVLKLLCSSIYFKSANKKSTEKGCFFVLYDFFFPIFALRKMVNHKS